VKIQIRSSLLVLSTVACIHAEETPKKLNAIYAHPVQISAMVANAAIPSGVSVVWLQGDYERFLKPGLSAIGGLQYFGASPSDANSSDVSGGFMDALAGIRWYPNHRFSGFYLQPQLDYERLFMSVDDNSESWSIGMNRWGLAGYLGFNGKWEVITVDWNVGFSYLTTGETIITKKDKSTGATESIDVTKEASELSDYILKPLMPSTTFSVGYLF